MFSQSLSELAENVEILEGLQLYFLGGVIKSGTTWVERILDSHPNAVCKGESHFGKLLNPAITNAFNQYNKVIGHKGNWQQHISSGLQSDDSSIYQYTENELDWLNRKMILMTMAKWLQSDQIQAVGEKTPGNTNDFERLQSFFPNSKFIYVLRDVRDVIVSGWFFGLSVNSTGILEQHGNIETYSKNLAKLWADDVRRGLSFIHQAGENGIFVRYEDLLADPVSEVEVLLQFLDLDYDDHLVDWIVKVTSFQSMSGGRQTGEENRNSFYRKGISGDWKNHISEEIEAEIEENYGDLLGALGYEV